MVLLTDLTDRAKTITNELGVQAIKEDCTTNKKHEQRQSQMNWGFKPRGFKPRGFKPQGRKNTCIEFLMSAYKSFVTGRLVRATLCETLTKVKVAVNALESAAILNDS
jgi:hypothetical protein